QWMSPSKVDPGRVCASSQVHSLGVLTRPSTFSRQSARLTRGGGPAVSTGNPGSAYWPGGSLVACPACSGRRRRLNPRDTNPPTVHLLISNPGMVQRIGPAVPRAGCGSLSAMAELHVLRVFAAPDGTGGGRRGGVWG